MANFNEKLTKMPRKFSPFNNAKLVIIRHTAKQISLIFTHMIYLLV